MVRTRGKRLVAFALAAITAVLLCSACAQQQPDENAEEEMSRGIQAPPALELVLVPANAEGSYTVTIGEANVTEDQQYAEDIPEAVTAEEARALEPDAEGTTSPGTDESDATTAASDSDGASEGQQTAEDNPEIVTVEENASEPEAVEVVGEPAVEAEEEMTRSAGDDGRWSLGNVKQEDVTVCYNVILSGDDGTTTSEVREAEVTGLTNNGDSIELSFTLSSGNDQAPDTYTVHFANTDRYAVVVVAQKANDFEVTAVDYEGQIAEEL